MTNSITNIVHVTIFHPLTIQFPNVDEFKGDWKIVLPDLTYTLTKFSLLDLRLQSSAPALELTITGDPDALITMPKVVEMITLVKDKLEEAWIAAQEHLDKIELLPGGLHGL